MHRRVVVATGVALVFLIAAAGACGSATSDGTDGSGTAAGATTGAGVGGTSSSHGGTSAHGGGSPAAGGSSTGASNGVGGGLQFDGGNTGGNSLTDASACAATSTKGQLTPLDMFIMLDQSKSMDEKANGVSKWTAVTQGIQTFVNDPTAVGVSVGIQYFGQPTAGGGNHAKDSCTISDYQSASVPIAPLPGNAAAIVASLGQHMPSTETPTAPALEGAILYAIAWETAHPDHTTVVVFATDGDPTECTVQDVPTIANYAQQGFDWNPSIRTYVIGMAGATTANLDAWAAAGGTMSSFDASDPTKFIAALNSIRGEALSCELQIPTPASGMLDYGLVNVQVAENGQTTELGQVATAAACDPTTGGWYYDNPQMPQHIEICDSTCTAFKAAEQQPGSSVEVDILLGCQTVMKGPHLGSACRLSPHRRSLSPAREREAAQRCR